MDLTTALAESCDTYFYELGKRFYLLPRERGHPLQAWANRFGLGEPTGIDITGETAGSIPTPEWLQGHVHAAKGYGVIDRIWKPGYSIEHGDRPGQMLVTPLQMTRFYAMIANGGKLVTPHVAEDVEQPAANGQPRRCCAASVPAAAADGRRSDARCSSCKEGLLEGAQSQASARRTACSASSRSRSPARRAPPRSWSRCPAIRTRST